MIDSQRLAYVAEAPVNWCPGLGTVLANEEVTAEGRSERGNFPVFRRPLRQWMLRITAYAERLLADLEPLEWPENVKAMQRHWIGRSTGARIRFRSTAGAIEVFTTRPDTVFGATFLALAPDHPMAGALTVGTWPAGTPAAWTRGAATPGEAVKSPGRFTGSWASHPVTGARLPVFVADYVVMGYGSGAIMGVAGQDDRDWEFAEAFELPVVRTVEPPAAFDGRAYTGEGRVINSGFLNGLDVAEAERRIMTWLVEHDAGAPTVAYRLRDWLFSRQRYWGEPFPIVYDEAGCRAAAGRDAPGRAAGHGGLRAAGLRSGRREHLPAAAAGPGHRVGDGHAGSGRRAEDLPPRAEHHASVGRLLLVRDSLS